MWLSSRRHLKRFGAMGQSQSGPSEISEPRLEAILEGSTEDGAKEIGLQVARSFKDRSSSHLNLEIHMISYDDTI